LFRIYIALSFLFFIIFLFQAKKRCLVDFFRALFETKPVSWLHFFSSSLLFFNHSFSFKNFRGINTIHTLIKTHTCNARAFDNKTSVAEPKSVDIIFLTIAIVVNIFQIKKITTLSFLSVGDKIIE
jgi:hypothetical protein